MWSSFRAVFYKEWLHIRRDRMTLMMTLMIPMIQMMVYGWMDTNVRHIPTVFCDESRSSESRRFLDELRATGTFDLTSVPSPTAARTAVVSSRAKVAVVIPPDFHDRMLRSENATVLVLVDGSESTVASTAVGATSGRSRRRCAAWPRAPGRAPGSSRRAPSSSSTRTRAPPTT
jgi:ABC-2 type transport system permease protein